jgi:hypothetical protein
MTFAFLLLGFVLETQALAEASLLGTALREKLGPG